MARIRMEFVAEDGTTTVMEQIGSGLDGVQTAADRAGASLDQLEARQRATGASADDLAQRAAAAGLTYDETAQRWRAANGAFASGAELAAAGIEQTGTAAESASGALGGLSGVVSGLGGLLTGVLAAGAVAAGAALVGLGAGLGSVVGFAGDSAQAVRDLQAQLGVSAQEAQALGDVAAQVFADNWYASVSEAAAAVGLIRQQLGDLADSDLRAVAGGAAALSDTFGADASEIVAAVRAIRDNFPGTSEAQALDMITAGFQRGLNGSGDFLESITEYSTQFNNGGATASQFFSILETGLATGVLGTDKAGDLFKEFVVRLQDGSSLTRDSLTQLGINADQVLTALANGTMQPIDAFNMVLDRLRATDNQATLMQAGVGLLGTQFEDLGAKAVLAIDTSNTSIADLAGATDGLAVKYQTFGALWEGFKRQSLLALKPIGDGLLGIANAAMPAVASALRTITGLLSGIAQQIAPLLNAARGWGAGLINQFASGMASAFGAVSGVISRLGAGIAGLMQPRSPPPFLSEIDTWGQDTAQVYLDAFGRADPGPGVDALRASLTDALSGVPADVAATVPPLAGGLLDLSGGELSFVDDLTGSLRGVLDSLQGIGNISQVDVIPRLLGSREALIGAINDMRSFGQISESTLQRIGAAFGPLAPQVSGLVRAYGDLQRATAEVSRAQDELNAITADITLGWRLNRRYYVGLAAEPKALAGS